jgi:hypothetical protein
VDKITAEVERPDWLKPGAEVVTWYPFSRMTYGVKVDKVKTVAGQSFALEDEREPRYRIRDLEAQTGRGYDRTTKRVAHVDSPEGVYWLLERDVNDYRQRADSLTVTWQRERTLQGAADLTHALSLWMAASARLNAMERPKRP